MADTDPTSACVVPDTNAWLSHNLLRSPASSALLFSLLRGKGLLGLPEVVELELRKQALRMAKECREKILQRARQLGDMLGTSPGQLLLGGSLPTDDQIAETLQARVATLDKLIVRVPFRQKHARRALERVLDGSPPNSSKNEQYKDSAIWEALIELGRTQAVKFVSADKAFFENREYTKGLANPLLEDCLQRGSTIELYSDISACASALGNVAPLPDRVAVETAVVRLARSAVEASTFIQDLQGRGWALDVAADTSVSAFLTLDPDVLAIVFAITFPLKRDRPGRKGKYEVTGSCSYRLSNGEASSLIMDVETVEAEDELTILSAGSAFNPLGALDKQGLAPLGWPSSGEDA